MGKSRRYPQKGRPIPLDDKKPRRTIKIVWGKIVDVRGKAFLYRWSIKIPRRKVTVVRGWVALYRWTIKNAADQ